mgnify:CR=1 FL=1
MLISITNKEMLIKFGEYKIKYIDILKKYSKEMKIDDIRLDDYNLEKAFNNIGLDNYYEYLIEIEGEIIGGIEYHKEISEIDNNEVISLDFIFIEERYRKKGYATKTLESIKYFENKRIEIPCYYNIPDIKKFIQKIGKELITTFIV